MGGMQRVLAALRPAVVALIAVTCLSMVSLALFQSDITAVELANFCPVECGLFLLSFYLLRKYKTGPVVSILGTGVLGVLICLLLGAV